MANRILITGGSGMVGRQLSLLLSNEGYEVVWLSRKGKAMTNVKGYQWDIMSQTADNEAFDDLFGIIHLAGEGIANKRWTSKQKEKIINSRVKSANLLFVKLKELKVTPQVVITASGVGYYGYDNGSIELDENAPPGNDFVAEVVKKWEAVANQFQTLEARVVKLRIGMVLSSNGGALEKMAMPIKWGVGAPLGNGKQIVSWIHIHDLCRLFLFALSNEKVEGVYNAVTANSITNKLLTKAIAITLKRPLLLPNIPSFMLKLMLGELSNLVLGSGKISPNKIINSGFEFQYSEIEVALQQLLKSK